MVALSRSSYKFTDMPDAFLFFSHGCPVGGRLLLSLSGVYNRNSERIIAQYLRSEDRSSVNAKICRVSILPADVSTELPVLLTITWRVK